MRLDEDSERVCMVVEIHRSWNFDWESIPIDLTTGERQHDQMFEGMVGILHSRKGSNSVEVSPCVCRPCKATQSCCRLAPMQLPVASLLRNPTQTEVFEHSSRNLQ